jgi:hypothetical protein
MAYSAPGKLPELSDALLNRWSAAISGIFDRQVKVAENETSPPSQTAWLYNPIKAGGGNSAEASITWTAFPKKISDQSPVPGKAWQRADNNRDDQEEYCEWEVVRDSGPERKVLRVTFSCETEDYYTFLAEETPDMLLALYRQHVSPQVQLSDLMDGDKYKPQNKWNYPQNSGAHGIIMHMAQVNNSFEAAVNLTAVASWPRIDRNGGAITGEQELIACRPFGDKARHSDPHIGAQINALVRAGNEVSFADPVGLYMHSFDTSDWETPDGSPSDSLMRIVRGSKEFALRVVFEAPQGSGFSLGDVRIGGRKIQFGGQIAEKIRIRIRGIARKAANTAPNLQCRSDIAALNLSTLVRADTPVAFGAPPSRIVPHVSIMSPE